MNKKYVVIVLCAALLVVGGIFYTLIVMSAKTETKVNWLYDYDKALSRAKDENKPILMDFYTDWCSWCKKLDAETYGNETVAALLNESFICLKVDAERHADLAKEYDVLGYPTIVFLSPDREEIGRIVGYERPNKFLQDARNLLTQWTSAQKEGSRADTFKVCRSYLGNHIRTLTRQSLLLRIGRRF